MTDETTDADAFRAFEHAGWEQQFAGYHEYFEQLTSQAISALLDAANVEAGVQVLDVATGAGYAAAAAGKRSAKPIGIDFSASQVAMARRRYPELRFEVGDAGELAFDEATFDAVVTNFGLLHFPEPYRALAEANRVLRAGGRIAFTVWASPDQAVGLGIMLAAIQEQGDMNIPLPPGPSFFKFSDPAECQRALRETGFEEPAVNTVPQTWRFPSADALFQAVINGTVRTRALLQAQTSEALAKIRAAMREKARAYEHEGIVELPMPAILASARKP